MRTKELANLVWRGSDGRWVCPSTSPDATVQEYYIAVQGGGRRKGMLVCNCPAGRHGKSCKHTEAVRKVQLRERGWYGMCFATYEAARATKKRVVQDKEGRYWAIWRKRR